MKTAITAKEFDLLEYLMAHPWQVLSGFYELKRQLTYNCEYYGSKLVIADRFYRVINN